MRLKYAIAISAGAIALNACSAVPQALVSGDASASGQTELPAPVTPAVLPVKWSKTLANFATRPAVIGGQAIYTDGSAIASVNIGDGQTVWARDFTDPVTGSIYLGPPIASQGRVLTAASTAGLGGLYTFDANGSQTGSLNFHQFYGEIAGDGTLVASVFGGYGSGTPVLSTLNFSRAWFLGFGNNPASGPITITGGRAFMVMGNSVIGFDPASPCVLVPPPFAVGNYCIPTWSKSLQGAQAVSNAGRGRIAVASTNGTVSVLDGATGALEFATASAGGSLSPSAHSGQGRLFTTGADGLLRVYDADGCGGASCTPLWTGAIGSASTVAPTVRRGNVYVATNDGRLVTFSASGCGTPSCEPIAIGDSGTGAAAGARALVYLGRALVPYGKTLYAFKTL